MSWNSRGGMVKHPKRPRDPNQLGKLIVDLSVGEASEAELIPDSPAVEFARQGGLKGGQARAKALTSERRREIARIAAMRRWGTGLKRQQRVRSCAEHALFSRELRGEAGVNDNTNDVAVTTFVLP